MILLIAAGGIFYLFFRQLFSGDYPRRGVDYEAKVPEERIGGINRPDKTFSRSTEKPGRIEELLSIADESLEKGDNLEAKKALQSALILDENNPEILRRLGVVYMNMNDYSDARKTYEKLLELDPNDDLAHGSLANALHKLGEEEAALREHHEALRLDPDYAPHHYNYANTLYDLGRREEALAEYRKALELDSDLKEAKKMIEELSR
ncbi:tetratricopeptide repeat protein [Nitratifractor salsuginis]|uniref:tetratricopeptide repeat protein n=1 Tax=Nitratifractor salsuginis TaxID=269261 RepID=UPI001FDEB387|nr:tetratricopeptide repeat protein [Nitratifractor salsuginis]